MMLGIEPMQVMRPTPDVLSEVLLDEVNLAVWQRRLPASIERFAAALTSQPAPLAERLTLEFDPDNGEPDLQGLVAQYRQLEGYADFVADVTWLAKAYGFLLGARRLGVRLRVLDSTMCPRFHVDHVPMRLITTYIGPGSDWLGEGAIRRADLGSAAAEPQGDSMIHRLECGHVALAKGEKWAGNEGRGLVHRSPPVPAGERRLLVTMDWLA